MTRRKRPNRRSSDGPARHIYTGLLAEPLPPLPDLDPGAPPAGFSGTPEEWLARVEHLKRQHREGFLKRFWLLCKHHGIDPAGLDVVVPQLLLALMAAHVPAFDAQRGVDEFWRRRPTKRGQPTRLDTVGTFALLAEAGTFIEEELRVSGKRPSDREIATNLSRLDRFKKLGLDAETIRKLFLQIKRAGRDYSSGNATEFQAQFIEELVPIMRSKSVST